MSTELSKPTTTEYEDGGHYKPKNRLGEHTENVDIHILRHRRPGCYVTAITVYAIIDDPTHGAPYEATGRELLHVYTREIAGDLPVDHEQSWFDIQSNGWNDTDDVLHHQSLVFHQVVKAAAEAGLAMIRGVES